MLLCVCVSVLLLCVLIPTCSFLCADLHQEPDRQLAGGQGEQGGLSKVTAMDTSVDRPPWSSKGEEA